MSTSQLVSVEQAAARSGLAHTPTSLLAWFPGQSAQEFDLGVLVQELEEPLPLPVVRRVS